MTDDIKADEDKQEESAQSITSVAQDVIAKSLLNQAKNKMKKKGLLLGLFSLPLLNIVIMLLVDLLSTNVYYNWFPVFMGMNFLFVSSVIVLCFNKVSENHEKSMFYKGFQKGVLFFILLAVVAPLLLVGGCFVVIAPF